MSPFSHQPNQTVAALGETGLIRAIRTWLGSSCPPSPLGIGDDCAVLPAFRGAGQQALTVDPVVYGRHFDDSLRPEAVGQKLLKRNLSDLAAMGAKPTCAVVALLVDHRLKLTWLERFYRGLAACARQYRVSIVGGDVAQADGLLAASLTLLGRSAAGRMVTRSGAAIGDWIYVTGKLGGSLKSHHFRFIPRLEEGAWLATRKEVRAMIDLSDGLAKDLHSLVPKGARPAIVAARVPISPAAKQLSRQTNRPSLEHAASDGEDYELLFVVAKDADRAAFERAWKKRFPLLLTCIGRFVKRGELTTDTVDLSAYHGYEHLR